MIETPLAILNVREIAAVARDIETRLSCLVIGTNDLAKEMRARIVPGRAPVLPLLVMAIAAARAYELDILDGPFNDLANARRSCASECAAGARSRFRRQDAHPPEPDRALQRGVHAERGGNRAGARDHRRIRAAGEPRQGRDRARRPHGRAAARRHGAAHGGDRRCDRGARNVMTRQGRHRRRRAGGLSGRGLAARQEIRRADRHSRRRAGAAVSAAAFVQGLRQRRGEGRARCCCGGGFLHHQQYRRYGSTAALPAIDRAAHAGRSRGRRTRRL